MALKLLGRGHKPPILIKAWNAHLQKHSQDRITNYARLRHCFCRMLIRASYQTKQWVPKRPSNTQHNSKPHQQSLQEELPSFSLPIQTLKEKPPLVCSNLSDK